jgi:xanthine dehydrogenase FAD-binding subunit
MDNFRYMAPRSLPEALEILQERAGEVKVLAGGTDLLVQMKEGTARPAHLLDISGLDALRGIRRQQGHLWIGPLTTHHELAHSGLVQEHGLALAQGAGEVGSPQIRHRGTIGGNIANASPAADTVPPLVVLEAEVEISSGSSSRWMAVESLLTGPAQTALRSEELITAVRFPLHPRNSRSRYDKFGSRNALSIAVASVAVAAATDASGQLAEVRIALGSVGPTVLRASGAEDLLAGEGLSEDLIVRAAASAGQQCCPIDDIRGSAWYRRQLVSALLARMLLSWRDGTEPEERGGLYR